MMIKLRFGLGRWEEVIFCLTLLAARTFVLNYISLHLQGKHESGPEDAAGRNARSTLQLQRNNEKGSKRVNYICSKRVIFTKTFSIIHDGSHKFSKLEGAVFFQNKIKH